MRREKSNKKKQKKKMSSVNVAMRLNLETSIQIEARILRQQHTTHFGRTVAYTCSRIQTSHTGFYSRIYCLRSLVCGDGAIKSRIRVNFDVIRVVFEAYLGTQTEWNSP